MTEADAAELAEFLAAAKVSLARAFVAAYGPDRGEDALAEAVAFAWENHERLRSMANPVGYLFRVGQSRTRSRKHVTLFPAPAHVGMPEIEPGLVAALSALSERQRVCTLLVHAYDWTPPEVAALLGISSSSVRRHIERAMSVLRRQLGKIDE